MDRDLNPTGPAYRFKTSSEKKNARPAEAQPASKQVFKGACLVNTLL
jgi:hypothetical protein